MNRIAFAFLIVAVTAGSLGAAAVPPSVAQTLRIDPALMSSPSYVGPYPALAAFLAEHPEIAHNPSFFLGEYRQSGLQTQVLGFTGNVLAGIGVFTGFLVLVVTIGGLVRSLIGLGALALLAPIALYLVLAND
jgi:hypothetical protein